MITSSPFKWRHFEPEIILCGVHWYLRSSLSYRDVEELMLERGMSVDHTTVFRWVQRYAPELDKRSRPHLTRLSDSIGENIVHVTYFSDTIAKPNTTNKKRP